MSPVLDTYVVSAASWGTSDSTQKMVNEWTWTRTAVPDTTANPNNMYGKNEFSNVQIYRSTSDSRYYLEVTGGNTITAANIAEMLTHFDGNSEQCVGIYFHGATSLENNWWDSLKSATSAYTTIQRIDIESGAAKMTIGSRALEGFTGQLHFYNSIFESIGDSAFANTTNQFEFYGTVTNMSAEAFSGSHVTYAYVKSRTGANTTFGEKVFKGCQDLLAFRCDSTSFNLSDEMFMNSGIQEFITGSNTKITADSTQNCFTGSGIVDLDLQRLQAGSVIGDNFCQNCEYLNTVTMSVEVTQIGMNAFENCSALESVTFINPHTMPTNPKIASIGEHAFYNCGNLSRISLRGETNTVLWDTITQIGQEAFYGCSSLDIKKLPSNSSYVFIDVGTFQNTGITQLTIPESVTEIANNAFSGCSKLTSVIHGSQAGSLVIGNNAFYNCPSLATVTLPSGLTQIGKQAFKDDAAITTLDFTKFTSLQKIDEEAFVGTKLQSVDLSVVAIPTIENRAFANITELTDIKLNPAQVLDNPSITEGETPDMSNSPFYVDSYVKTTISGVPEVPTDESWTCWDYWYYLNRNGMVIKFMVRGKEETQVVNCNLGTNNNDGQFIAGLYESLLNQKSQFIPKNHLVIEDFDGDKDGNFWYRLEDGKRVPFSNDGSIIDAEWCEMGCPISFTLYSYAPYFVTLHDLDGKTFKVLEVMDGEVTGSLPSLDAENCTFKYWCTDAAATQQFNTTTPITTSIDLYPYCEVFVKYKNAGLPDGMTTPNDSLLTEQKIAYGSTLTRPTMRNLEEYRFDDFYTEGMEQFDFSAPIKENTTILANYISNDTVQVRVHLLSEENDVNVSTAKVGDSYTVPEFADTIQDGDQFIGYLKYYPRIDASMAELAIKENGAQPGDTLTLSGDLDLYAVVRIPYELVGFDEEKFKEDNQDYAIMRTTESIRGGSAPMCQAIGDKTAYEFFEDKECTVLLGSKAAYFNLRTVYAKETSLEGKSKLSITDITTGQHFTKLYNTGDTISDWSSIGMSSSDLRTFEGMAGSDGVEVPTPYTVPAGTVNLKPVYSITVTLDPMGGTLKSVNNFKYMCGEKLPTNSSYFADNLLAYASDNIITENAAKIILDTPPTKNGVQFFGWYYDKLYTKPFNNGDTVNQNTTLYARYADTVHTVYNMWDSHDYRVLDNTKIEESFLLKNEPANDYNIMGWEYTYASLDEAKLGLDPDVGTWYEFVPGVTGIDGDIAINAIGSVQVNFVTGDSATRIESQEIKRGTVATVPRVPLRFDAEFVGWYTSADYATEFDFSTPIKQNITLYAKWKMNDPERIAVTVSYPKTIVTYNAIKGEPFDESDRYDVAGAHYKGLYYDEGYTRPYSAATPLMEDTSLFAKYTVNVSANTLGGTVVDPIEVIYGRGVTIQGNPTKSGNTFDGWYTDLQYKTKFTSGSPLYSDTYIYAKWKANADTTNGTDEPMTHETPKYQAYTANGAQPLGYYVPPQSTGKVAFAPGWVNPIGEGRAAEDVVNTLEEAGLTPDTTELGDVPKTGDDSISMELLLAIIAIMAIAGGALFFNIRRAEKK